ncbi:MAG: helix-turn-helix domain-containing protein [Terriglobia bacterium]|jgi:hypothetical protein
MNEEMKTIRYPRLEALVAQQGLIMKGIWSLLDTAQLFPTRLPGKHVSVRTIQDWIKDGKLVPRDLPGRGRFLSQDLEAFLQGSLRKKNGANEQEES